MSGATPPQHSMPWWNAQGRPNRSTSREVSCNQSAVCVESMHVYITSLPEVRLATTMGP